MDNFDAVTTYRKKLIEVAIPLEAINTASAREKSIRHGHPSTLHLWWARRPLAACRAVLFAQLVDDPSSRVDELMADPRLRALAETELPRRVAAWQKSKAAAQGAVADSPEPALEDVAIEIERKRLFAIIEDLVMWENSTNEEVLERARAEIRKSCDGKLPPVYDPFSGGGSIPLEAQRLGLPAHGSDLNPVAVMIGKAMIEIPPKFKDMPPIHPGAKEQQFYRNAEGLAEDVKYYGEWMRDKAWQRIGHAYPQVALSQTYGGGNATVVAWIWARAVPSPNPAFAEGLTPLVNSFILSSKKSEHTIARPIIDKLTTKIDFEVFNGQVSAAELAIAKKGTKSGKAEHFLCSFSGEAITREYIRECAKAGKMKLILLAGVVEKSGRKIFISANTKGLSAPLPDSDMRHVQDIRNKFLSGSTPIRAMVTGGVCSAYGMETWGDLFTDRQVLALDAFSDLIQDLKNEIESDSLTLGNFPTNQKAREYAEAMAVLMTCAVGRAADFWSSNATWESSGGFISHVFTRQGLPMVWDFAEGNPFSSGTGNWLNTSVEWVVRVIRALTPLTSGNIKMADAASVTYDRKYVFSTDPPYFDNISYAVLSDYFYIWHRKALRNIFPDVYGLLSTPKDEELIAMPYRTGGDKSAAEDFFVSGMRSAMSNLALSAIPDSVITIYYAFKQSEIKSEGTSSTGWATFLQAVIEADLAVVGTWPVRTERSARLVAAGTNALANSVVLVCRKRSKLAGTVTRAEFIRALKRELPSAIFALQAANITPADMPQSAIGPGMGVFSRYKAVLEADDSAMTVKTALQLINAGLDDYLGGIQGEFDAETRFAITWFEQNGLRVGEYGTANSIATARGISVESAKHAGIVESAAGKVRLLSRDEIDEAWEPAGDSHLTIWECLQHLVRLHQRDGVSYQTALMMRKIGEHAEAVKDLAYCLYDISANKRQDAKEATAYNALIADWTDLTREAAAITQVIGNRQARMEF
jgi:putative DNA methylase